MATPDLLFGLYFVEVTIELELFLFFIFGWHREERTNKRDMASLLGLYFLCLAIGRAFLIFYDFYYPIDPFYYSGIGISLLGMLAFIYLAEKIIPKNTHFFFTILSFILFISIFFLALNTVKDILYSMIPFIFLIGFVFLGYLIKKTVGSVKISFISVFIGQFLFGVGAGLMTDWISEWFLMSPRFFDIKPIGLSCTISGLIIIAVAFWRLPSLTEIEWHSKMLSLYVITNEHGICCIYYPFKQEFKEKLAPQLISGGVTGIIALVKEMTSSKMHLKEIDHEDIKILFEYGIYSTAVLLVEDDLQVYHYKLQKFIHQFETQFKEQFVNWTGSVSEFTSVSPLIAQIFEQKEKSLEPPFCEPDL
ncbi:MAG: hypothetical protein ACTSRC_08665 [Candidatus Helarchaeota archaeon]